MFLAQDLRHQRPVALKVLHPHLAATLGPERFLREIQIAARLQHPHILPLFDSGQAGDLLYYVMPYVEGESLRDRLNREKQLSIDDAVKIARDVAAALDYAHRHQVVHRDIKPENVMLHEGEALVTDFGIAKAITVAGSETITQTGVSVGTPAYMSPEQAAGEGEPDGRSDVYSLGCMLYEMLAGVTPFTGPTAQAIITKRFTEPVPSLRAARSTIPEAVEQAVTKAMARIPADRYSTASLMGQALAAPSGTTPPGNALARGAPQTGAAKSIAVLPFANMSADPENEYFTDGIAEEIINALTKIQALRVASRTSSFAFKGKNSDIRKIGEQLSVGTVLEGSVRKAGSKLRITAQLVNVSDGYHLWSERYDRQLEDVFAIQDEIAENIVRSLRVMLSEQEKRAIEKAPTADVAAYDYYLRGRQFFHQFRKTSLEFACQMYARAIERDPKYALAYAALADCCSFLSMYWVASQENLEQADAASRKALALDPELAEAHASRGVALTLSQRYAEAEEEFQTAIRLNPQLFEAHYFHGGACFQQGKMAEAAASYERACAVRPEDYQAPGLLALAYDGMGRQAESAAARGQALRLVERHLELNPDDVRALYMGAMHLLQAGQEQRGLAWARRAQTLDPEDSLLMYNLACFYALQGHAEDALDCLEKSIQSGFGHREWIENDADLVSVRLLPRFQELMRKL